MHPILILGPSGLFAATNWGTAAEANPGAHGFSEIVYQYSSASANNGSAFDGLGVTYGLNDNPNPSPQAIPWDIGTGLVMLFSRYLPIIAPIAMAFYLGRKKEAPATLGTMSDDTVTFGFLLLGHDRGRRRAPVPARRGARTSGRASRADPIRRLIPPRNARSAALSRASPLELQEFDFMSTTSVPAPAINLARRQDLFSSEIVVNALKQSVLMLRPDVQWKNPVMFVVEIGAVLTLLYVIQGALGQSSSAVSLTYFIALDIWLWLTVLFANFATAVAEERGKAQAETLRRTRVATPGLSPSRR